MAIGYPFQSQNAPTAGICICSDVRFIGHGFSISAKFNAEKCGQNMKVAGPIEIVKQLLTRQDDDFLGLNGNKIK